MHDIEEFLIFVSAFRRHHVTDHTYGLQQISHFTKGSLELSEAKKIPAQNKQAYKHLFMTEIHFSYYLHNHVMSCKSSFIPPWPFMEVAAHRY